MKSEMFICILLLLWLGLELKLGVRVFIEKNLAILTKLLCLFDINWI